jgi:sugar/nucleoside kinase (ribokinase family)
VQSPEFDILGLGTIAVDDLVYVERYPPPDRKAMIHCERRTLGGQVATALAAASKLGARCAYGGALGQDELSMAALGGLRGHGIDCRFVRATAPAGPVHSIIIIDESAKTRNIFFDTSRMTPPPLPDIGEALIGSARVLLLDQFNPPTMIRAAECAHALGVPVVMDMEWLHAARIEVLMSLADHLLLPHDFAAAYTGLTASEEIVCALHRGRRACTAVTCGAEGCYFLTSDSAAEVCHLPAVRVATVETTGCGDVFHGAYATALGAGHPVLECLRFAAAAAAAFAARPGGWEHLPALSDVNQLLSSMH